MYILLERVGLLFICSYWILYPEIYRLLSKKNKNIFLFFLLFYGIFKLLAGNTFVHQRYENILFKIDNSYYEHLKRYEKSMKAWERTIEYNK
jgi:hypothetical protein